MLVNMKEMLQKARQEKKAIPAFNVFGFEEAISIIYVAQKLNAPVILMSNKDFVDYMGVKCIIGLLRPLAESATVPVCIHMDHAKTIELAKDAIDVGYTSVMFDGSSLSLEKNISMTKSVVDYAHGAGVTVEGEIGSVGYTDRNENIKTLYTKPEEAQLFAVETGVDVMAISVGNVQRMYNQSASIQFDLIDSIALLTSTPLAIHGASGISDIDITRMSLGQVAKFNIGTSLRIAFGEELYKTLQGGEKIYDRLVLFQKPIDAMKDVVYNKYKLMGY